MEVATKRTIKSGREFDHLFPSANGHDKVVRSHANVGHTIDLIIDIVHSTLPDTIKLARRLKAPTMRETASNIWHFVYDHIRYVRDLPGIEQVRRPARTWADRIGDCDCLTVFIASCWINAYPDHPITMRVTRYGDSTHFTHVYPIVPLADGTHITLDAVAEEFDFEHPYASKRDTSMQLHYLNGLEDAGQPAAVLDAADYAANRTGELTVDAADLLDADDDLGFLKNLGKKIASGKAAEAVRLATQGKIGQAAKAGVQAATNHAKSTIHNINRINPGTALLRGGFILSLKTNVFHVAERLRYAYLSDAEVRALGLPLSVVNRYRNILQHTARLFHRMGGKPENMRKAILTGKGNSKQPLNPGSHVSATIASTFQRWPVDDPIPLHPASATYARAEANPPRKHLKIAVPVNGLGQPATIREVLGDELYVSEFPSGLNGLGQLGEPTTAAALAAAAGTMATIAGLLKNAGDIKHQAERITGQPLLTKNFTPASPAGDASAATKEVNPAAVTAAQTAHTEALANGATEEMAQQAARDAFDQSPPADGDTNQDAQPSATLEWFKNNWQWLVPAGVAGAALLTWGGIALTNHLKQKKAEKKAKAQQAAQPKRTIGSGLSGTAKRKTAKRKPVANDPFSGLVGSPLKPAARKPAKKAPKKAARKTAGRAASKAPTRRTKTRSTGAGIFDGLSGSPLRKPAKRKSTKRSTPRTSSKSTSRKSAASRLSFL